MLPRLRLKAYPQPREAVRSRTREVQQAAALRHVHGIFFCAAGYGEYELFPVKSLKSQGEPPLKTVLNGEISPVHGYSFSAAAEKERGMRVAVAQDELFARAQLNAVFGLSYFKHSVTLSFVIPFILVVVL